MIPSNDLQPSLSNFWRRLAAIFYDALALAGILFFATACLLPFNGGEAFQPNNILYSGYLFIVSFLFFGWFWTHGGQTLGMRAWKIRVCTLQGDALSWRQAFLRFITALLSWSLFGLGFLWILLSKRKAGWHDILSRTKIVRQGAS